MNGAKVFVDTNILIYAHDTSAGRKHQIARERVFELWNQKNGVVSTQVLQEFFVCITRKIPCPVDIQTGKKIVEDLLSWETVVNDGNAILDAIDIQNRYHFSFWDALILQAATKAGANVMLSEDLTAGHKIRGVTIQNPFS